MVTSTRRQTITCLSSRRWCYLIAIVVICLLVLWLPGPPQTQNNISPDRPSPKYQVTNTPRFLYRSPFRSHPDIGYEEHLSNSLRSIENSVLAQNHGNIIAEDRIWQIALGEARKGPDSAAFEQVNMDWAYSLVTDNEAEDFVSRRFSAIPDIATIYKSYPQNVLRADLLRYLLLWYYGGFYADVDVLPTRPIHACPELKGTNHDVSLVVGVEVDEPFATKKFMNDWHWTRSYGLIQYTMHAPRRFSPLLRQTIVRAISHTRQHEIRHHSLFGGPKYDENTILGVTGPDVFTDAILDTLSSSLPPTHPLIRASLAADEGIDDLVLNGNGNKEKRVTWAPFHRMKTPICVQSDEAISDAPMGGVCVLPISIWGNGQRHSEAGGFNDPSACVNHRFGRTWKKGWWEYIFG
ncbi:unnamed protein product [Penicillium salamii]|nr:unnamed protein product [Penicillium salamii]CAG8341684.1 unnamed protein product [Penicillium salamii]